MDAMESLDYRTPDNFPLRKWYNSANLKKYNLDKTMSKWFLYILLGFILGMIAIAVRKSVNALQELRLGFIEQYMATGQHFLAFFSNFGLNLVYVLISAVIVQLCGVLEFSDFCLSHQPLSGGSGIPEVKGYLNGVRIVNTINLKTFVGKLTSIIFSYSSALALGPEGPMVHIGAMVGGGLAAAKSRTLRIRLPWVFESLRTERDQRDFIAAGAAAGITAAFGTPVGGVLFALEETASFWSRELTWRTLFACMLSSFTVNILTSVGEGKSLIDDYGLLTFGFSRNYLYRYQELLIFIFIGVMGGLIASLFIKLNVALNKWRRDYLTSGYVRIVEALFVAAVTSMLTFGIPVLFRCKPDSEITYLSTGCEDDFYNTTKKPDPIFCPNHEQFNDMANLMITPAEEALRLLFSRTNGIFDFSALGIFFGVYFVLLVMTSGLAIANGLFVPMMLLGGTFGRIIGQTVQIVFSHVNPPIDASIYALIGSTAFMSGFSRITISLCVIVVELTENTQYLLPIIVTVMFAKWVGDALTHSIYDEFMELKSIPFLEHHPPQETNLLTITDVMARDPICLRNIDTLANIVDAINSTHNGFPVVIDEGLERPKTYHGFILKKQLLILLDRQLFHGASDSAAGILDYEYISVLMNHKPIPIEQIRLPSREVQSQLVMDLRPYMDRSQIVAQTSFHFTEVYNLFKALGLRHLPVVDEKFQVVGMITRHDLLSWAFD